MCHDIRVVLASVCRSSAFAGCIKKRTQHSFSYSFRLGSGIALGQELEKVACALVGGRIKHALTYSFDPLVRFTRFNRIEIWPLQVNANRYLTILSSYNLKF